VAIKFTVDHDHTYEGDEGEEQLVGWIHFEVTTKAGDLRAGVSGGNPKTVKLPRRSAWLAADGHLYKDATSGLPFRLVANDPEFNLDHLTYKATFELTTLLGVPVDVPHTYFPAPSTDTTAYITRFLRDPDQTVMEVRAKLYAEDIIDLSDYGRAVLTGSGPVAYGSIVAVDSATNAEAGEMVDADATNGGFTITLPEEPPDLTVVSARKKDTTANPVLVQRSGSDVFTGGVSLVQLLLPGESGAWQYHSGVWRPVAHSQTVPGLDTRYFVRNFIPGDTVGSRLMDANGAAALYIDNTANAVNHLRIVNSATGQPVRIQPSSIIDAIINTVISPKGDTTAYVVIRDGPGNDVARFESVANAVNYVRLVNSPTGSSVTMRPGGADTTCNFTIRCKGDDGVIHLAGAAGNSIAGFICQPNPVNSWLFRNSSTGATLNAYAIGSDTDRSFNFVPGGAGTLKVNDVDVMTQTNTYSVFNKLIVPRVTSAASGSISPVASSTGSDLYALTALAGGCTISAPSSTASNGQIMRFRFKDNGTSRALTWNSIYREIGVTLPSATTVNKTTYVTCIYNSADTKWDAISVQTEV